jgi:hypothetical protein
MAVASRVSADDGACDRVEAEAEAEAEARAGPGAGEVSVAAVAGSTVGPADTPSTRAAASNVRVVLLVINMVNS